MAVENLVNVLSLHSVIAVTLPVSIVQNTEELLDFPFTGSCNIYFQIFGV